MIPIPEGYNLLTDATEVVESGDLLEGKKSWTIVKNSIGKTIIDLLPRMVIRPIKEDSMPPQTTLTKEQLKHAFETVPEGCVVIMEPETVLKEGDFFLQDRIWHKSINTLGDSLKYHKLNLAARPITPTPPKGYYLIYNPEEIIKKGDWFLDEMYNMWTLIETATGDKLKNLELPYILRRWTYREEYIPTYQKISEPQPAKENIIEPIQFSIEHL